MSSIEPFSSVRRVPALDHFLPEGSSGVAITRYWVTAIRISQPQVRDTAEVILKSMDKFPSRLLPFMEGMSLPTWDRPAYDPLVSIKNPAKHRSVTYSRLVFLHSKSTTVEQRHWLALAAQTFGYGEDIQEAMLREPDND